MTSGLSVICMPYAGQTTLVDVLDRTLEPDFPRRADQITEAISDASSRGEQQTAADSRFHGTWVDGIVTIAADLAEALVYSHGEGIVHSDIKPSNALLTPAGRALLIDFNLSHGEASELRFGGTFPYMAPEQLRGLTGEADPRTDERDIRTDIFALGATLFELLTGKLPFDVDSTGPEATEEERAATAQRLLERQEQGAPSLPKLNPQIDADLAATIERCVAFRPEDRWQTPDALLKALKKHQTKPQRLRRWFDAHRKPVFAAAGIFLVALGALGGYIATRESDTARQMRLGQVALIEHRPVVAIACFNTALQADLEEDERLDVLMGRGQALLQAGDVDAAMKDFKEVEARRGDPLAVAAVGYCFALKKVYFSGAERFQRAATLGWDDPLALSNNVGYCRAAMAKLKEAEEDLTVALQIAPSSPTVLHNLGIVNHRLAARGQPRDLSFIIRATEVSEPSAELWLDLATHAAIASDRVLGRKGWPDSAQVEQSREFAEIAISAARKSVDAGVIPSRLKGRVAHYLPEMSEEIETLLRSQPPAEPPPPVKHFISPFEKLTGLGRAVGNPNG